MNRIYLEKIDIETAFLVKEWTDFEDPRLVGYNYSSLSDFEIGSRTFEIGGKSKGKKQIENAVEGYVVKDQIEFGSGNTLPLWWFGFNY